MKRVEFPRVSYEEWWAKAERELRGRGVRELWFEQGGWELPPLYSGGEVKNTIEENSDVVNSWSIGYEVDLGAITKHAAITKTGAITQSDGVNAGSDVIALGNNAILAALQHGAQTLLLRSPTPLSPQDHNRLLAGVYPDMITLLETTGDQAPPGTHWIETTDDYFLTIAHHRAVRRLLEGSETKIATRVPYDPAFDPDTNRIRFTAQALAAVTGGTDYLFIDPSDGRPGTDFSRRISLNIQHLLREEAKLEQAVDAAAGSYYLEALTDIVYQNLTNTTP